METDRTFLSGSSVVVVPNKRMFQSSNNRSTLIALRERGIVSCTENVKRLADLSYHWP
jgi:hypothetical protein